MAIPGMFEARHVLAALQSASKAWARVRAMRAKLPPAYRARIPADRTPQLRAIVLKLAQARALRIADGGLGFPWVVVGLGIIAIPATVGAVAAVRSQRARVLQEERLAIEAVHTARQAQVAYVREKQQARLVGDERAREMAAQRAAESRGLVTSYRPPATGTDPFGVQVTLPDMPPLPGMPGDGSPGWFEAMFEPLKRYGLIMGVGAAVIVTVGVLGQSRARRAR